MLAFLIAGLTSVLWAMFVSEKVPLKPTQALSWEQVSEGAVTHRIAKELANVPFAEWAADLERAASWLAIGDTGSRVRQGCAGWLYLADELKVFPHADANAAARAQKVIALHEQLAAQGIALLVAVVPDKSRIVADQRCSVFRSALFDGRARDWLAQLQAAGVASVDLTLALQPLGDAAFLKTDTHWSEKGADAAAQVIAARVGELGIKAIPAKQFTTTVSEPAVRPGDLVHLAGLDWLPLALQPQPETVSATQFQEVANGTDDMQLAADDLFGNSQLPNIAVIGTSFSRNSNFIPFLERALSARVGNFAMDGGAFSGAAKAYFKSAAFKQTPPKLVVWEIPERDLQAPYIDDIALGNH
jgi:alginate O-acetyltransferase complex protein AlgJ